MTKLERARDATLAKYDGLLEYAFIPNKKAVLVGIRPSCFECAFCQQFVDCDGCPIDIAESLDSCCGRIIVKLAAEIKAGRPVPAIWAAMIYLWGFEE